ncbi:MAG: hypothetical protein JSR47_09680 [Proteobacteria bacterium]|nr:hypothetical protein [Pseudomonadota bacterium]
MGTEHATYLGIVALVAVVYLIGRFGITSQSAIGTFLRGLFFPALKECRNCHRPMRSDAHACPYCEAKV